MKTTFLFSILIILFLIIITLYFLYTRSLSLDKYSPLLVLFNPLVVLRHVFIVVGSFSHWSYSYFILSNSKGLYSSKSSFFFLRSFLVLLFSFTDFGYTHLLKAVFGSHFSVLFARFGRFLYLYIVLLMSIGFFLSFYPLLLHSLMRFVTGKGSPSDLASFDSWLSYFNRFYIPLVSSLISLHGFFTFLYSLPMLIFIPSLNSFLSWFNSNIHNFYSSSFKFFYFIFITPSYLSDSLRHLDS
jgi:hypothetical protein